MKNTPNDLKIRLRSTPALTIVLFFKTLSAVLASLVLCSLVLCSQVSALEVYTWVDENGRTHYSTEKPANEHATKKNNINNQYSPSSGTPAYLQRYMDSTPTPTNDSGQPLVGKGPVTLFSTEWCGYCRKAREYMRKNNIVFKDYDIEKSPVAQKLYQQHGGKGIPLLVFGDKRMRGFSAERFETLYYSK